MSQELERNLFFVKEHTGIFKAANNFDIYDPNTNQLILTCREEKLGWLTKIFRFTKYKRHTPFDIEIKNPQGELIVRVKRPATFLLSKIQILDAHHRLIGQVIQRIFSFKLFQVLDPSGLELFSLKGKWNLWNFSFVSGLVEYAKISKKWAGLGKELFTSADNYMLEISENLPKDDPKRKLILAMVMCIDMVLKEH